MNIASFEFIFFLIIAVLGYYVIPGRIRPYFLLIINMVFYMSFGIRYFILIILEAFITYLAGITISRELHVHPKRVIYIAANILITSILLLYKVGHAIDASIIIPLGISFYTLQAISYISDVYKGSIEVERRFFSLLTFLSFFPTITSEEIREQYNYINELAKEYKAPFINGCMLIDEIGMDYSVDSYGDGGHLNDSGAKKYTMWLEEYLEDNYDLLDRRSMPGYEAYK